MKKLLLLLFLTLFSFSASAGKKDMILALNDIPGIADSSWAQDISLWIVMSNPNAGHDFDYYGSMLCNGGQQNFGVAKGYTITFWNAYTKKPIKKFRCY